MARVLVRSLITAAVMAAAGLAWARSGSFMGARTGAPSESNCTACHSGTNNAGSGVLQLNMPAMYDPGDTLDLSVSLSNTGMVRWGFEITALDMAGDQPAGRFIISDPTHTEDSTDSGTGRQYVFQTNAGTYDGTANASSGWSMRWEAPSAGTGTVTFYLAGLAANSGSGAGGDSAYTVTLDVPENTAVSVDEPDGGHRPATPTLTGNEPNPFNAGTRIRFELPRAGRVGLDIYNSRGALVRHMDLGSRSAGLHSVHWDGTGEARRSLPSGTYLYQLSTTSGSVNGKMVLLK